MNNIDRATKIISDTLGVMTFSAENATYRLAKAGLLMPDDATTQTETVGPYFPEDEEMPDLPEGTDVTRIVGPWEEA
jgi:hypothetical protein